LIPDATERGPQKKENNSHAATFDSSLRWLAARAFTNALSSAFSAFV
jgi:hypothetical protein